MQQWVAEAAKTADEPGILTQLRESAIPPVLTPQEQELVKLFPPKDGAKVRKNTTQHKRGSFVGVSP